MKHLCLKETQGKMKMSFPQSLSGNPEDKRTGFPRIKYGAGSVKHGMTGRRGFSGKVSSSKSQVPSFQTPNCSLFTDRGFTLIETIMVMVIIAILSAVVIIRNPFGDIKLYSATRKVAADIRYVQKLAISNQTRAGITFNANGYSVYPNITDLTTLAQSPGDPCSSWTDISKPPPNIFFVVDFTDASRCSNYSTVTITIPPTPNQFAFNSLGTPVDSGGNTIGGQTVRVTYKGSNKDITIEQGTGRVSY